MELIVKTRNTKVSDRQREYIEAKLAKLERYFDQLNKVTVEVSEEQRRNEGNVHRVQVTLIGERGLLLRSEQRAGDMRTATDLVADTLQRQVQRYKDKHWRRGKLRRQGGKIVDVIANGNPAPAETDDMPSIMRTKEIQIKPMFSDEAVEQMELLGHDFFVFRDADTDQINVVYRRRDGHYGLLVPDETYVT
ncbi:MAG: ribosome-associated translation inhibitor RaiA [Chloroflexi bacterium AL-W]|nr:ribosome-associated translation inhibitor RaiA [Chloroflexi bacterium AL-N1]NOK64559.1 ribosome-associated translation inhibitor RaiA [Chloroflexi bacterium AL-N10]NOK75801.1 ribosome-associated translation inhibitor RaiA [Chloroflexi bacterium AL-N5]NOK80440.1 ribosome-associated translation inhibitor RaiA [Chloroflexi bacterium AL-W]NOK86954.1 ribosome-associated translation inhibitor RaiA [Chloroflexi bacterium AL-N15]